MVSNSKRDRCFSVDQECPFFFFLRAGVGGGGDEEDPFPLPSHFPNDKVMVSLSWRMEFRVPGALLYKHPSRQGRKPFVQEA